MLRFTISVIFFLFLLIISVFFFSPNPSLAIDPENLVLLESNIALGKPVVVTTNGANDTRESPGLHPSDITDGSLEYLPSSSAREDGTVGFVNDDYNQLMVITVTIDLQGSYDISKIRYNMGNVERANTWNPDLMITPFGTTPTNPGSSTGGAWTEQTGFANLSILTIRFEKTRGSFATDWLFIGEIEVEGTPTSSSRPVFDLPVSYPNRGQATEQEFLTAWQKCITSYFDHNEPFKKNPPQSDGIVWLFSGDKINGDVNPNTCEPVEACYDGHEGYDFDDFSCHGPQVYPVAEGEIIASGWSNQGYGNFIRIRHGNTGYETLYGHLSNINVNSGHVDSNTRIGTIGNTGCGRCGTHLHLNVYHNGKLVDPSGWYGSYIDPWITAGGTESFRLWKYEIRRESLVNRESGVTFVAPSNNTVAYILPQSYGQDFQMSLTEIAPLNVPDQLISAGHGAIIEFSDINNSPITELSRNYTLEMRFNNTDIVNIYPQSLALYLWNPQSSIWEQLPTQITFGQNNNAFTNINMSGYYALMGNIKHSTYIPLVQR